MPSANRRLAIWYGALVIVFIIFGARLFYLQIIRYDHYRTAALADQLKKITIEPERGLIEAHEGNSTVPLVLNQKLYTLYADPTLIKLVGNTATRVANVTHANPTQYFELMQTPHTRYVVLATHLDDYQNTVIQSLKLPGVGTIPEDYRTYPQGTLASQLLGFVNDAGQGNYGIEQALNNQLGGKAGMLKSITDARGVPLVASRDNIKVNPVNGSNVVLTIDMGIQAQMEKILKDEYQKTKSKGLSAIIMDPRNGQIKAMANYPTYDPSQYQKVTDANLFQNNVVSNAIEPGSTMKNLTTAAALDMGVVKPDTTFYDPAHWLVDGFNITDIEEDGGAGTKSLGDLLNLSLNTGATWLLMQMGGGQINQQGRDRWHDYMVNHYQLGKSTNIEQGYEGDGYVPSPDKGYGLNLTYANTAFGQGVTLTALQMAAALSSILNGGTFYQPHLVDQIISSGGQVKTQGSTVVRRNVVKPQVSTEIQSLMEFVVTQHYKTMGFNYLNFPANFIVGGKTGTAQIANPKGGYFNDQFNGTYAGFVGGDKPQYVIVVYNLDPVVPGYAGALGGQPVFADLAHMLINGSYVEPKSGS